MVCARYGEGDTILHAVKGRLERGEGELEVVQALWRVRLAELVTASFVICELACECGRGALKARYLGGLGT